MKKKDKGRLPPFVPLLRETIATPAWKAMSHGARSLYIALKSRCSSNLGNNGHVHLSVREAAEMIGSHRDQVARWFHELEHYGFIVMTKGGSLGVNGMGKAPHWRLTECACDKDLPTKDYLRWNGAKYKHRPPKRTGTKLRALHGMAAASSSVM
jgi:hypothetical protein